MKPNIVLIVADTARFESVSRETAPSITEFGENGTTYTNAIATAPWTLPSHASLFTGKYPSAHGAHAGNKRLSDANRTVVEALRDAGYETVGVSNNTWISPEFGFARGFETFRKNWQYIQSSVDFGEVARNREGLTKLFAAAKKGLRGNPLVNAVNLIYGQFGRSHSDNGAKRSNEWIEDWVNSRDDDRPFMLFVNYLEPHLEYRPPEQYANKFLPDSVSFDEAMDANQDAWQYIAGKVEMTDRDFDVLRALYDAEINYLDEQIASLVASLKEADEWEDTVCVIVGDHGENIGDHGLMDHQYSLYETLVNVPLIVHGRGFGGNSTVDQLVQLTDIPPTLLDVAGVDETAFNSECQGKPLPSPAAPSTREFTVSEYLAPQPSMSALQRRVGELPPEVYQYDTSLRAIRTHEWKLVRQEDGSTELYDLSEDAMEIENVVDEYGDIAETLEEQLDQWLDSFEHATPGTGAEMSEETKNRLEELGYLQ